MIKQNKLGKRMMERERESVRELERLGRKERKGEEGGT